MQMNLSLQSMMIAATATLTLIISMVGVIFWQSSKIDRAADVAANLKVELSVCQSNAASRLSQIKRQNEALTTIKAEAEDRRRAALKARDDALSALNKISSDYAALRDDWPQDCVSAVGRVRDELGL